MGNALTILLILIIPFIGLGQYNDTYYFDPDYGSGGNGTISQPYDHITDVTISDSTDYLIKRGTQMDLTASIALQDQDLIDIRFRAYGSGTTLPILYMSDAARDIFKIQANNHIIIDSIHMLNYDATTGAVRGVQLSAGSGEMPNTKNITISNCEIESGYIGVNVDLGIDTFHVDNLHIINTEIHGMGQEAIFIRDTRSALIDGCHMYDMNQLWHTSGHLETESPGDGIQTGHDCINLKIYNTIVDKRDTGNKYALLVGGKNHINKITGEIIGCTFYAPKDTTDDNGGVAVSFQKPNDTCPDIRILFARNIISGRKDVNGNLPRAAMDTRCDTFYFHYNILDSIDGSLGTSAISGDCDYSEVFNNIIMGGAASATNVFGAHADSVRIKNNLAAGNTSGKPLNTYSTKLDTSHNYQIASSNTNLFNAYLDITDWETSDFTRTSNLNDGIDVGLLYDIDSTAVSNPPERGIDEFDTGARIYTIKGHAVKIKGHLVK